MSEKIIRIKSGNEESTMNVTEEEYQRYYRPWWQQKKHEQRNREAMEQNGYTEESYEEWKENDMRTELFAESMEELAEKRMLLGVLQDAMDSLLPEERELAMKVFGEEMPLASKGISATFFMGIVERFLKKYPFPSTENRKSVITTVKGYKIICPGKEGTGPMEKSQELIGILQAISIVAKSLAAKLVQIEKEVEAYEAAKAAHDKKTLRMIADKVGDGFIVLPSSLHETIILLPKDTKTYDGLAKMVREVNDTQVDREERLSYHVYVYSRDEETLRIVA